jgi:WD40 repeat protein
MKSPPTGEVFVTLEELSGESETGLERSVTLWDLSGKHRVLPGRLHPDAFSPDGKILAVSVYNADHYVTAINVLDVETGNLKLSIPINESLASANVAAFAPDGKLMVGDIRVFMGRSNRQISQSRLVFWETATGRELASFTPEEKNEILIWPTFSTDGNRLLAANWRGERGKLFFFDMTNRKLTKTIVFGDKDRVAQPAASSDGKWFAVMTQEIPEGIRPATPLDLAQPRIHLIDAATSEICETLVAPQCFATTPCFSPDGKTLATGGHGRVLLWDLGRPPGSLEGNSSK